ncbi:hypothetical protein [Niallia taxi]|nr:hypothetical protein [Niallia taxi]MDE5050914.1 hypothetical protein [Niallia taxi]MDK8639234.1 hypothetical protein [Niallia taxi]MED4037038.1 hypothetical protein [Niallia taxi]MED4053146.1 hypothetical protein [Niallia taxi]MED4118986.1 hypothetical protein [Niallia taxi]
MIKIPADKLAAAVNKHLLPGVIRSLSKEQAKKKDDGRKST